MSAGHDTLEALGASWANPLSLTPFCSSGSGKSSGRNSSAACCAPTLRFQPRPTGIACAALHVDVLCYAPKDMPAQQALEEVCVAACRALHDCRHYVITSLCTHSLWKARDVACQACRRCKAPGINHLQQGISVHCQGNCCDLHCSLETSLSCWMSPRDSCASFQETPTFVQQTATLQGPETAQRGGPDGLTLGVCS